MIYSVTFDKAGMMPVVWRAESMDQALAVIAQAGNQDRISRGYSATITEWSN